jgi:hypothetical protein
MNRNFHYLNFTERVMYCRHTSFVKFAKNEIKKKKLEDDKKTVFSSGFPISQFFLFRCLI